MFRVVVAALLGAGASAFVAVRPAAALRGNSLFARTSITGGNWKMNPLTLKEAQDLAHALTKECVNMPGDAIIFPPYPFLGPIGEIVKGTPIKLGAQSIFFEDKGTQPRPQRGNRGNPGPVLGAYTGAVAASMVASMGVTHVLAGHSERRTVFKDDDMAINKKVLKILSAGMVPVLCVGESKAEREAAPATLETQPRMTYDAQLVESVVAIQLAKDLAGVSADDMKKIIIAYEPVWAIGTGLVCPAAEAQVVHKFVRSKLATMFSTEVADAVRIQYGGSVTPESVDELMGMADIDGCLVGGASLLSDKFARILNYKAM